MSGRKIPRAFWRAGRYFFMNISTNCTSAAITRMNTTVCRYPISNLLRICITGQVTSSAITITKTTAPPIPTDELILFDTPRNEQIPRNCDSTKLLTRTIAIKITIRFTIMSVLLPILPEQA